MDNDLTFGKLSSIARKQAGNLSLNDVEPDMMMAYVNLKLMKMYKVLDGIDDPWYNKSTQLTVAADQEQLKDSTQGGTITAMTVNSTTITITRSAGLFVAGSLIDLVLVDNATGHVLNQCKARVSAGGAAATAEIISGTMITFVGASHHLAVNVTKSLSVSSVDISALSVKDFISIYDTNYTGVPGTHNRVFTPYKDLKLFRSLDTDPMHAYSVSYIHTGNSILLTVGASAYPLDVVNCDYRGKPTIYTAATENNSLDFPPENNNILIDEVTASLLVHVNKAVPEDTAKRIDDWYKTADAGENKKENEKNK